MSLTLIGLFGGLIGTLLINFGFSETCSNEIVTVAPLALGSLVAWYGRWRKGDIKWYGGRKDPE